MSLSSRAGVCFGDLGTVIPYVIRRFSSQKIARALGCKNKKRKTKIKYPPPHTRRTTNISHVRVPVSGLWSTWHSNGEAKYMWPQWRRLWYFPGTALWAMGPPRNTRNTKQRQTARRPQSYVSGRASSIIKQSHACALAVAGAPRAQLLPGTGVWLIQILK